MQTVIGIGSNHGADAIGWRVVERLQAKGLSDTNLILAREPSDILRFCDCAKVLHLVDGCIGSETGRVHRITWPDPRIARLPWTTSHGIDIPGALELAVALGILPAKVTLWCIECVTLECGSFNPGRGTLGELQRAMDTAIEEISASLAKRPIVHQ